MKINSLTRRMLHVLTGLCLAITMQHAQAADAPPPGSLPPPDTVRLSARDAEILANSGAQAKFLKLLDMPGAMAAFELNEIDFEVKHIAFYRMTDRQNKRFPRTLYESIEQKMINKFTQVRRFAVHECLECKTTKVSLSKGQFSVLRQLDSNDSMSEIGKKISVDHFVFWDAYLDQGQAVINIRVVSSDSGQVRWSRQYRSPDTEIDSQLEFYTSFWGMSATRKKTTADADAVVSPFIAIGMNTRTRSTITERLYYGYGAEVFFNTASRTEIPLYGFTVNGRIALELDGLFSGRQKNYGNWLLYGSMAQAFIGMVPTLMVGGGLEIRPYKYAFIDLGGNYMMSKVVDVTALKAYEDKITMGGFGYNITFGVRY